MTKQQIQNFINDISNLGDFDEYCATMLKNEDISLYTACRFYVQDVLDINPDKYIEKYC